MVGGAVLLVTAGCAGSARLSFVSLNSSAIDPPPATVYRFDPQQCYYWTDETGRLNVAMQFDNFSPLFAAGKMTLQVSLALDAPPAGSGRNYPVGQQEMRGRLVSPLEQHRFTSVAGIVAVTRRKNGRMEGSFRLWVRHYPGLSLFSLFPQPPGVFLLFGTFEGTADAARGRAIRDATESGGWQRTMPRSAASQPATKPVGVR